jgi:uncharacterized membrane protein YhhN
MKQSSIDFSFPQSSQLVTFTSLALVLLYFYRPNPLIKIFPIAALILFLRESHQISESQETRAMKKLAIWALVFSGIGDVLLEIDDSNMQSSPFLFLGGLVSFLSAHLIYIKAFFADITLLSTSLKLLLIVYYFVMMCVLLPHAEANLVLPIVIYGFVIASMAATMMARFRVTNTTMSSKILALLGSLSFVISDSILAVNKFTVPINHGKAYVMITYYLAQILLAISTNYEAIRTTND